MNFFTKLFKKKAVVEIPPMPSWETVVEMMYDKHLDAFSDEVVKVIYSKDRSMRYVVLKDEKDFSLINWKQSINSMKMNGNIFAHTTMRYLQCGSLSEGLLENRFLKT